MPSVVANPAKLASDNRARGEASLLPNKRLIASLLLAASIFIVYAHVGSLHFTSYDDYDYVVYNDHVTSGLSLQNFKWVLTATQAANWHPVTWMSHMLDCQFFGLSPAGPHWMNLLIHVINALLLFGLLVKTTGHVGRSLVVALLFGIHPLNVESVAWIAERKNVLSTLFLFLTVFAYLGYVKKPAIARYLLVLVIFALGLMSKPALVPLPILLLVLDYWPLQRWSRAAIGEKIPLFLMAILSSVITLMAQSFGQTVRSTVAYPLVNRVENTVVAYCWYIGKALWPTKLVVFYPHPHGLLPLWQVCVAAALLLVISIWAIKKRTTQPWILAGWLWYLVALIPVIGLVQVGDQAVADRYAYIPLSGIFWIVTWSLAEWANKGERRIQVAGALAVLVISALSLATWKEISYWYDGVTLFTRAIEVTGPNYLAEDDLAEALVQVGRPEEALSHFQLAGAVNERNAVAHYDVASMLFQRARYAEAVDQYQIVPYLAADRVLWAKSHNNAAVALTALGHEDAAEREYHAAIAADESADLAESGLAALLYREARYQESMEHFRRALALRQTTAAFVGLGKDLEATNRLPEALAAYEAALKLSPGSAEPTRLARALEKRVKP